MAIGGSLQVSKVSKQEYRNLQLALPLQELTCHMGAHSVNYHVADVTFPPFPSAKLVLILATPYGCMAELT